MRFYTAEFIMTRMRMIERRRHPLRLEILYHEISKSRGQYAFSDPAIENRGSGGIKQKAGTDNQR